MSESGEPQPGSDVSGHRTLCIDPATLSRRTLNSLVILGPAADDPLVLQGTAPIIWELLQEPTTISEVAVALGDAFGVDAGVVQADIGPLLDLLRSTGALR